MRKRRTAGDGARLYRPAEKGLVSHSPPGQGGELRHFFTPTAVAIAPEPLPPLIRASVPG